MSGCVQHLVQSRRHRRLVRCEVQELSIKLQDAITQLYDVSVVQGKATSTKRLDVLAEFCVQELERRGMSGALTDQDIPGGGRTKNWDVTWNYDAKFRLAISLKSLLKNVAGTVPNRIDDLMGEITNAQLYSPEIVLGYLMVFDTSNDSHSPKHGMNWIEVLRTRLERLSGRSPPHWTTGTIESHLLVAVDFSNGPELVSSATDCDPFFDSLASQVRLRNPNALH